jgi:hypothetical protein
MQTGKTNIVYIKPPVSLEEDIKRESKKFSLNFQKSFTNLRNNIHKNFKNEYESGKKTGRFYDVTFISPSVKKLHRASAEGETPAKITGELLRRTQYEIKNDKESKSLTIIDGTEKSYSYFLEFGTRKVKPRLGFKQAINKSQDRFYKDLIEYE